MFYKLFRQVLDRMDKDMFESPYKTSFDDIDIWNEFDRSICCCDKHKKDSEDGKVKEKSKKVVDKFVNGKHVYHELTKTEDGKVIKTEKWSNNLPTDNEEKKELPKDKSDVVFDITIDCGKDDKPKACCKKEGKVEKDAKTCCKKENNAEKDVKELQEKYDSLIANYKRQYEILLDHYKKQAEKYLALKDKFRKLQNLLKEEGQEKGNDA